MRTWFRRKKSHTNESLELNRSRASASLASGWISAHRSPFKPISSFDPDTLKMLQAAYDEACQWLAEADGFELGDETRKALALRIFACAKHGERDLHKLKTHALAEVY